MSIDYHSTILRRLTLCLLTLVAGIGSALILLLLAGGPARPAYAGTLTYPGCGTLIQDCIDSATAGDTILISAGDYTQSLTLSRAVSLTGELSSTTILHALPNTRVLTVTGAAVDSGVVISGLTFAGGHAVGAGCPDGCGGAILITATAQPLLINLTISNSLADVFGGGLYVDMGSALMMSGSAVLSNTSPGFVGFDSGGGGLYNSGYLTITSSTISNNHVIHLGGGVYNSGYLTITSSFVSNNNSQGNAGGIFSNGTLTLASSTVTSNTAYEGGGIFSFGTLTLTSSTVTSNTAFASGGGVYNSANLTIAGGAISDNNSGAHGGGLFNSGTLTLASSAVSGNTAFDGGGLYNGNSGNGTLTSLTVTGNTGTGNPGSSGGGISNYGILTITSSTISNNAAPGSGGLYTDGNLAIVSSTISSNTATGYYGGGLANDRNLAITGSTITGNTATGYGGGIASFGTLTMTSSTITSNTATAYGGGVYNGGGLTITSASISNNTATVGGGISNGGVFAFTRSGRIVDALFVGNRASQQGAALYLASPDNVAILNSTIASPTLGSGAAIVVVSGTVGITDTIIASYTTGISQTAGSVVQDYNLFFGNGTNTVGTLTDGANSFIGNPLFLNPAGGDYHLSAGSLAIDAGTDAGVSVDFDGDLRPQGAGFDIGFDESPYTAVAEVGLTKTASASVRLPGQTLTYTLVYSNAGPQVAVTVRLTDIVPANLVAITYTSSGAALTPVGLTNYAWQVANLAPGAGGVVTVTGVLSGGLHGTVFTNGATITTTTLDSSAANNTSAVSVTVANVPPVAADEAYTISVNTTLTVAAPGVLVNDIDANGDPLTAVLAAGPLTGTFNLHADGSFTYTPPLGYSGVVTFNYRANDGLADSNAATVTITVTPPVANLGVVKSASAILLAPGQHLTYTLVFSNAGPNLAAGVRLTDIVPANLVAITYSSSGAALTPVGLTNYAWQVANLAPGAGGVVTVTGVLRASPHGTVFTNTATITTTTFDSNAANNTSAVIVTVANVPPVAADDAYTVTGNTTLTVTTPGVLANDSDTNNDTLTAVLVTNPLTGVLNLHAGGSFTYTPPRGFTGGLTFTYRANDGLADSNAATVTITVTAASYQVYLPMLLRR